MSESIFPRIRFDDYADRSLACQFALEPAFQELAVRAQAVGWSEDDVSTALLEIAHHHISGFIANRKIKLEMRMRRDLLLRGYFDAPSCIRHK